MTIPSRRPPSSGARPLTPGSSAGEERHERPGGLPELRVAVVGGGLSGLCAGLALARAGWLVTIIERAAGEPPGARAWAWTAACWPG